MHPHQNFAGPNNSCEWPRVAEEAVLSGQLFKIEWPLSSQKETVQNFVLYYKPTGRVDSRWSTLLVPTGTIVMYLGAYIHPNPICPDLPKHCVILYQESKCVIEKRFLHRIQNQDLTQEVK
jgi:hypothetical protein